MKQPMKVVSDVIQNSKGFMLTVSDLQPGQASRRLIIIYPRVEICVRINAKDFNQVDEGSDGSSIRYWNFF